MDKFAEDVLTGLRSRPRQLPSKYFYDRNGDRLFQAIMHSPEYYLTDCEYEIFDLQRSALADFILSRLPEFDLVELGAGDCFKSKCLLKELLARELDFTFFPVDISKNSIEQLKVNLPQEMPALKLRALNGEYFPMLKEARRLSERPLAVLLLGSNIGNMETSATETFLDEMKSLLREGDLVLIGFDLKKDPHTILAAYNDRAGITRAFNLNLLERINRELNADIDLRNFTHFPVYDPASGSCRSYLVSLREQEVYLEALQERIRFKAFEPILTEISQKYTEEEIAALAGKTGFEPVAAFFDSRHWFTDVIWTCC